MIRNVHLENVATYKKGTDFSPKKFNFIYGANGTGKSTISKVLYGEVGSQESKIEWPSEIHEDIIVYNRSFVERNFQDNRELKGIFTLGEESIDIQKEIEEKRKDIDNAEGQKSNFQRSIDKIESDMLAIRNDIEIKCWNVQKQYGTEFSEALTGYRGKMKNFCDQCIATSKELKEEDVLKLDDLRILYQAAFMKGASQDEKYQRILIEDVRTLDYHELLGAIIVGKTDSPIGTFIQFLKSSDWVKAGIAYSKKVPGKCPYCQRELPDNIQKDIEDYFDENYEKSKIALNRYAQSYSDMVEKIKSIITSIDENHLSYIDYAEFDIKKIKLLAVLDKNLQIIQKKINALSEPVELESVLDLTSEIAILIDSFNAKIDKNNELVRNQNEARKNCKEKVWKFLTWQCNSDILNFQKQYSGKEKGKNQIVLKRKQQNELIRNLKKEIEEKESQLTSVRPTVDAINNILNGFGFMGFLLAVNESQIGTYKIIRPSGEDASSTLSEGEHNFISFLYFYHLCFGSQTKTGLANNKILVIDDPISSLDSNVLFIVSTLVKNILRYCKNDEQGIKQVIILTHNVYFHKEITYWGNKDALPSTETRYYVLRKKSEETSIEEYETNPISTSYELLWKELKNPNLDSSNTLLNVMRRILEHYFTVVGGINYEACINQFDGTDKIICKALIAFINDGSHSVFEDLIFMPDDGNMENYKRVFRLVFEKLGHIEHYNMMMSKQ